MLRNSPTTRVQVAGARTRGGGYTTKLHGPAHPSWRLTKLWFSVSQGSDVEDRGLGMVEKDEWRRGLAGRGVAFRGPTEASCPVWRAGAIVEAQSERWER